MQFRRCFLSSTVDPIQVRVQFVKTALIIFSFKFNLRVFLSREANFILPHIYLKGLFILILNVLFPSINTLLNSHKHTLITGDLRYITINFIKG